MRVGDAVARLSAALEVTGDNPKFEGLVAGRDDEELLGLATCDFPSVEVLEQAAAARCNLVLADGHPFYAYDAVWSVLAGGPAAVAASPVAVAKAKWVEEHKIAVARWPSAIGAKLSGDAAVALGLSLGLNQPLATSPGASFAVASTAPTTLAALARSISQARGLSGLRIIGSSGLRVRRVAIAPGLASPALLRECLGDPTVDVVIAGDVVEWEGTPYFQDCLAAGRDAGLILIGFGASKSVLPAITAQWLKPIFPELRILPLAQRQAIREPAAP